MTERDIQETPVFKPSRILCPIDFSDLSRLALKYAAAGARVLVAGTAVFGHPGGIADGIAALRAAAGNIQ